jgi:adenylate cyclase
MKEIEYKFLVDVALLPPLDNGVVITQGYLSDKPTVRVRTYGDRGFLTVKGEGLISRDEYEYEIPYQDAISMLKMCSKKLVKERFLVNFANNKWEIDFFKGYHDGLVIAEIEVPDGPYKFEVPSWAIENVSHDPKYLNVNLAF